MATHRSDLVPLSEAARLLGVSYDCILVWTRKGVFQRVVRVGPAQSIRLYREDVLGQRSEQRIA